MKNFKLKRLLSLAFIGCLSTLSATTVFAAAGDTISNTATLDYDIDGVGQTPITSASADFIEDNLVNFQVDWTEGNVSATAGAGGQMMTFIVTNNGNGAQDFALTAADAAGDFNVTSIDNIFVDSGAAGTPGVYDATDIATFIDELASGASVEVYVFATMPIAQPGGDTADIRLTATVHAGDAAGATGVLGAILVKENAAADVQASEQNVFNDPAGVADAIQDGVHSVDGTYIIVAANLSVTKTMDVIWDPINGNANPKGIPGALVQYTIVVANAAGGASGDLTTLTDTLSATGAGVGGLMLDPDFLQNDGATPALGALGRSFSVVHGGTSTRAAPVFCTADAPDVDGCSAGLAEGDTITIDFVTLMAAEGAYADGELMPGEDVTIVFNAFVQ